MNQFSRIPRVEKAVSQVSFHLRLTIALFSEFYRVMSAYFIEMHALQRRADQVMFQPPFWLAVSVVVPKARGGIMGNQSPFRCQNNLNDNNALLTFLLAGVTKVEPRFYHGVAISPSTCKVMEEPPATPNNIATKSSQKA